MIKILKQELETMLIEKYEKKYIRFKNGTEIGRIYEIRITEDEYLLLLNNSTTFNYILNKYISEGCKTSFLVLDTMNEYLKNEMNLSEKRIKNSITKLSEQPDIFYEFYNYILNEKFSENPIVVEGYTAQKLNETTFLSPLGAFNYLIYLRTEPQEALADLRKGLPRK